ncbi:hypothetical protein BT69DRAFT_244949 [Atractiella rhizophila]|nr:hypothetical protein BT69DRAFT_244949 [Atractiella rhizophila]
MAAFPVVGTPAGQLVRDPLMIVRNSLMTSSPGSGTMSPPHTSICKFERVHFWNGVSDDPPHLVWRTDRDTNPFVLPSPGGHRFFKFPFKTAEGVFDTALNPIWHIVAPLIIDLFEQNSIDYSSLKGARFSTYDDEGKKTLSPVTLWIATHPGSTTPEQCRDISPAVLKVLEDHGVNGVVLEWYEASVKQLAGLMSVVDETDPTYSVRRALTAALGLPIAPKEKEVQGKGRQKPDVQGSLGFYFHVNRDNKGQPSTEVMGVTCKHVLDSDSSTDYLYTGQGAPVRPIRVCGARRFDRVLTDSNKLVRDYHDEITRLTTEVERLKGEPADKRNERALRRKQEQADKLSEDTGIVEAWLRDVTTNFSAMDDRNIGHVHWAPKISIDEHNHYTRDIGTFRLNDAKFKDAFQGNLVDLGSKWNPSELNAMFWPNPVCRSGAKFASNRVHRISGFVDPKAMDNPNDIDENMVPVYIVGKDGNTTDFTIGRYAGLEAYIRDKFGKQSREACIYNFDRIIGSFASKGDSGSLVWTREGRMLGMLHSGEAKGFHNHVTYATPAWWLIKQILVQYPYADFGRTSF